MPGRMQELMQLIFPPDELPMPMGAMTPPGGMGTGRNMIWRGAEDLKKIMPQGSKVPAAPPAGQKISGAFDDYLKKIADLLQKGKR